MDSGEVCRRSQTSALRFPFSNLQASRNIQFRRKEDRLDEFFCAYTCTEMRKIRTFGMSVRLYLCCPMGKLQ